MIDSIAGYTYQVEHFTPVDLIEYMIGKGELSPAARTMGAEASLDQLANELGFDRGDERTFDSSEFPKVILNGQLTCADTDWTDDAPQCDGAPCDSCNN